MERQTPNEAFAARLREAREAARMTQAELADRVLEVVGYNLSRTAIALIEKGKRRVTLDDALAIAAALGVAPINLMVPFEDPEPVSEELAGKGLFNASVELEVGEKLSLLPLEARPWIDGTHAYPGSDPEQWFRYYVREVPPPRRWRIEHFVAAAREGRKPEWPKIEDEVVPQMGAFAPGRPGRWIGVPAPIWALLVNGGTVPEDEEEAE
jgi:transcriptional regulator with XRE-family HTH domain